MDPTPPRPTGPLVSWLDADRLLVAPARSLPVAGADDRCVWWGPIGTLHLTMKEQR